MSGLNHFDEKGNAVMVDVSEKSETKRVAVAKGSIKVSKEIMNLIKTGNIKKGDVLGVIKYYNDDGEILGTNKIVSRDDLCDISLKTRIKMILEN